MENSQLYIYMQKSIGEWNRRQAIKEQFRLVVLANRLTCEIAIFFYENAALYPTICLTNLQRPRSCRILADFQSLLIS